MKRNKLYFGFQYEQAVGKARHVEVTNQSIYYSNKLFSYAYEMALKGYSTEAIAKKLEVSVNEIRHLLQDEDVYKLYFADKNIRREHYKKIQDALKESEKKEQKRKQQAEIIIKVFLKMNGNLSLAATHLKIDYNLLKDYIASGAYLPYLSFFDEDLRTQLRTFTLQQGVKLYAQQEEDKQKRKEK